MRKLSPTAIKIASITGIFLGAFALSALADWTEPKSVAPNCITDSSDLNYDEGCNAPLNVGSSYQTKIGGLFIGKKVNVNTSLSNPDVEGLNVWGNTKLFNNLVVSNVLDQSKSKVSIGWAGGGQTAQLDVQNGPIKATGGLIIQTRTAAEGNPTSPETGRMWLMVP